MSFSRTFAPGSAMDFVGRRYSGSRSAPAAAIPHKARHRPKGLALLEPNARLTMSEAAALKSQKGAKLLKRSSRGLTLPAKARASPPRAIKPSASEIRLGRGFDWALHRMTQRLARLAALIKRARRSVWLDRLLVPRAHSVLDDL